MQSPDTPEYDDNDDVEPIKESPVKKAPRTAAEMMAAIKAMKAGGQITSSQAQNLRSELGVTKASFTKRRDSGAVKKQQRKAQKAARRTGGRGRG